MPTRSQRHLREFQGQDSAGDSEPIPGPPLTGAGPATATVANVGAAGRAVAALTAAGGQSPFTWAVSSAGALGVAVSGASLRTTTNPVRAAGIGAFPVGIVATDVNGHTFPYTITVTLT
jgi:hypothetical protein